MELENTNRIIGDFFEINSDIVYNEHTSKFPKFIARLISKYYRNKLNEPSRLAAWIQILDAYTNQNPVYAFVVYIM